MRWRRRKKSSISSVFVCACSAVLKYENESDNTRPLRYLHETTGALRWPGSETKERKRRDRKHLRRKLALRRARVALAISETSEWTCHDVEGKLLSETGSICSSAEGHSLQFVPGAPPHEQEAINDA